MWRSFLLKNAIGRALESSTVELSQISENWSELIEKWNSMAIHFKTCFFNQTIVETIFQSNNLLAPATCANNRILLVYLCDLSFPIHILGIENNQAPNPYVANAGSVYQPTASDMAYSHLKLMRSQFHKKMKTVLLSISSLSGNNYNLENPENAIFERTRSNRSPIFFKSSI